MVHRVEYGTAERLPDEVLEFVWAEASKRQLGRGEAARFREWYVVANRNRMMKFTNEFIDVRVFPRSGTCRVLERQPLGWLRTRVYFEHALFEAGLDLRICERLSYTLQHSSGSRIFPVGQKVPPFKIEYYKESV